MTQEERDNLLLDMKEQLGNLEETVNTKISGLEDTMISRFKNIDERFEKVDQELRRLSQRIAVMEIEHGTKIQLLLETVSDPLNRIISIMDKVDSHDDSLYKHDIRIATLESKVNNL